ncbi:polysaccharide biosynthesis tyrosine autokinase [Cryobacterium sp. Y82]|uniref:polysaccharide biosynthesis tyrosine autokinase n=1 Tax=Cryobacterium sp. Y82 TaxID=2045017 RepID=UPI000CE531A3|nr:polysaccharide biosynthesis tyrosine autokinase [Cryobacterium sp. Y82]
MALREDARILSKSWVVIVLLTVFGGGCGTAYVLLETPQFSASAKVFVSAQSAGSVADLAQGNSFTVQRVKTYVDLVDTPIVLNKVIQRLDLADDEDSLALRVEATTPAETSIIEIKVTDADPALAAAIANATAQSLADVVIEIEAPQTADAVNPIKLTLVKTAAAPAAPVSPKKALSIALGVLAGLALGVLCAVLREVLETRIRNESDIARITDVPVLGWIRYERGTLPRPSLTDPRGKRAESFGTLRTNLQFLDADRAERTFIVTSSIASEGKSSTASNVAIAFANSGSRVLLVDADLRRPRLAEIMGLEGAVGLTDVLMGRAELSEVVQPWGSGGLSVLPAGYVPPNPIDLLGSARMKRLINDFTAGYDIVIFDTPPLLPVSDAAILAHNAGGAILVVAIGRTRRHQLARALSALEKAGAPIFGLVMTMLRTKETDADGYGTYESETTAKLLRAPDVPATPRRLADDLSVTTDGSPQSPTLSVG